MGSGIASAVIASPLFVINSRLDDKGRDCLVALMSNYFLSLGIEISRKIDSRKGKPANTMKGTKERVSKKVL